MSDTIKSHFVIEVKDPSGSYPPQDVKLSSLDDYIGSEEGTGIVTIAEQGESFTFEPDVHLYNTVVMTPLFGYCEFKLSGMEDGDTLRVVATSTMEVTSPEVTMVPSSVTALGIVTFQMIGGVVYASTGSGAISPTTIGKNKFNKATVIPGKYILADGELGTSAGASVSAHIPVTVGDKMVLYPISSSPTVNLAFYDVNGTFVSAIAYGTMYAVSGNTGKFEVPAGSSTVRITVLNASIDITQLEIGILATTYEPYGLVSALSSRMDAVEVPLFTQGFSTKIASIAARTDSVYEVLENKHLKSPMINESAIRASVDIGLADSAGTLKLTAIEPGTSGNAYIMHVDIGGETLAIDYTAGEFLISAPATTTCYELARALLAHDTIPTLFIIEYLEADAEKLVEAVADGTHFAGGVDGHVLTSSSTEIDAITPFVPVAGKPHPAVAATGSIELDTGISLDFTAKTKGSAGNNLIVNLIKSEVELAVSTVAVNGNEIDVTLAANGSLATTATAANVKTAIEASTPANALIAVAITGATSTIAMEGTAKFIDLNTGIDGTAAPAGKIMYEPDRLWIATDICTISNSDGWKSVALT